LEFSASVGFIHKESVTMHGHTVGKNCYSNGTVTASRYILWEKLQTGKGAQKGDQEYEV